MSGAGGRHWEQDKEATVYVGNLDERVTDQLVWELMLQAGPIQNVHLPKDRVTQGHQGFGFVEFLTEQDADYAAKIMNNVRLFGKPLRVNKASADKQKAVEIGAELFIGNLDTMIDEKALYDTFGRFGTLITAPKIARHEDGLSKGYGFVSYADFESSDEAINVMNGQYLMNKEISVQYAYKKDGKGERHGTEAERLLAKQAKAHGLEPATQPLNPMVQPSAPAMSNMPPAMMNGDGRGFPHAPVPPMAMGFPGAGPYSAPPHMQAHRVPAPLPPLPANLPARPPPSHGGLNGPTGFVPPGYPATPSPTPGFGGPTQPPPYGMPGRGPPGQGPHMGPPNGPPGGFAPPGYQPRRP